jgi:hypothetical protein
MTSYSSGTRALLISLLLLTFVAGAAAGVAGRNLLRPREPRVKLQMSAVLDRLDLTPEQRRQAEAVLVRSAPMSRTIVADFTERLRVVADSVDAELRGLLSAEQRAKLDAMRSDRRIIMKRKVAGSEGARVDTVLDAKVPPR